MSYSELLTDPRWQQKRLKIFERDNWACKRCGSTSSTLNIHHKKYGNGKPWEIDDIFLVTMCKECHSLEESLKKDLLGNLSKVTGYSCWWIHDLVLAMVFLKSEDNESYKKILSILDDRVRTDYDRYLSFLEDELKIKFT